MFSQVILYYIINIYKEREKERFIILLLNLVTIMKLEINIYNLIKFVILMPGCLKTVL